MAEQGFRPSESGFRGYAINHCQLCLRANLILRTEPNSSALPCFQGKLCIKILKNLKPSENFETYLIPNLTAAHIYLWFVKYTDLSKYVIQIIVYRYSLI